MNSEEFNPGSDTSPSDPRERCLAYLMGELEGADKRSFEQLLSDDAEMSALLMQQADTILGLDSLPLNDPRCTPAEAASAAASRHHPRWRWVAAIASIAAAIALVIQLGQLGGEPSLADGNSTQSMVSNDATSPGQSANDQMLLARAWASSHFDLVTDSAEIEDPALDDENDFVVEEESDFDSKVEWMFVAMTSEATSPVEGENDG